MTGEIDLRPEQIVAAAVDILREVGLDAVSMRSVAGRLGVTPPPQFFFRAHSHTMPGLILYSRSASLRPVEAGSVKVPMDWVNRKASGWM